MLDYDREAERYDATRGGAARAEAAAEAFGTLVPATATSLVDVGCGTGIVTARLARPGLRVAGVDRSAGMAAVAAGRLPGRVALGAAASLPLAAGSVDAVTMVWLLHLLDSESAAAAIAEAARVLAPGGALITTVDKNAAAWAAPSDLAALMRPVQAEHARRPADALDRVTDLAGGHGLRPAGRAAFAGTGQGRSPRWWRAALVSGRVRWASRADVDAMAALAASLAALPGQDEPRPDPVYQVVALVKDAEAAPAR